MIIDLIRVRAIVDHHLGCGILGRRGEVSYYCPFCNHKKRKLQVNLETQKWHCWVCNARGRSIGSLLYTSGASIQAFEEVKQLYGNSACHVGVKSTRELLTLPANYKPLHAVQNSISYRQALHYATTKRGLSLVDILRYQIGFCDEGPYGGMLIIPSYDHSGRLNFFTGRSYYKEVGVHKNPPISKDIIGFDSQINWDEPITIVEGAFDAITTKRNAIPLFGKLIQPALKHKITLNAKRVNIILDSDAVKSSIDLIEYFLEQGVEVYYVELPGKDPSELGYSAVQNAIQSTTRMDLTKLIKLKLNYPTAVDYLKKNW